MKSEIELSALLNDFMSSIESRKLSPRSLKSYRCIRFAAEKGKGTYYQELSNEYANYLNQRLERGDINEPTWRFNTRVLRMMVSLAESGEIDFSRKPIAQRAYILPEQGEKLAQNILEYSDIPERRYRDNIALVRHVLWYAKENGYEYFDLDDEVLLDFLSEEAPKSNGGDMARSMRVIRCVAKYFRDHNLGDVQYFYENLKIKGGGKKMLPSFTPEEVKAMIDCLETDVPVDRRNRALILLGYTTGLRCIDVIRLKLNEINWRKQCLNIIQSKTGVPMLIEIPAITLNALADYVLDYRPNIESDYVFIRGKSEFKEINRSLNWMIATVERRAGIEHKPFRGFHGLRRSFAVALASAEVPLETLSKMLGHISPTSDRPYLSFNRKEIEFVAMDFRDVPIRSKIYSNLLNLNNQQ